MPVGCIPGKSHAHHTKHSQEKHNVMRQNTERHGPVRQPVVAGLFYPDNAQDIRKLLERELSREAGRLAQHEVDGQIIGGVIPHAGLIYCARQAVHFFECLRRSGQRVDTVLIVHPNHAGYGPAVSTDGHAAWETPLGRVAVDTQMAEAMSLPLSAEAQSQEHSAEVILPYLQFFLGDPFKILSVNMLQQDVRHAEMLAAKAFSAASKLGRKVIILASSDFSHFLDPEESARLDDKLIAEILRKEVRTVFDVVTEQGITACGFGPIMSLMAYSAQMAPEYRMRLLRRGHSGEVSPSSKVVNYVCMLSEALLRA